MEPAVDAVLAPQAISHPDLTPAQMRQAVTAAAVGNALEFYDFITFAFFAIQIGKTFFPSADPFISLMGSLGTFGAGFLARPIGAWVIGGYADRKGRKPAMLLSMTLMGMAIVALTLIPGYATIGIAAPILAVTCRLVQGFALGGEVGSATTYMIEAVHEDRRGISSSWQGTSQQIAATTGAGIGMLLSAHLSGQQLTDWGWRLALAIGTLIVPFALIIRKSLPETLSHHRDRESHEPIPPVRSYIRVVILGALAIGSGTIVNYVFQYMATYGQNTLKLSATVSLAGEFVNNGVAIVGIIIGGWLSDRIGRRPVMIWPQLIFVIAIIPGFAILDRFRTAEAFLSVNAVLSVLNSFYAGALYAAICESLPTAVRSRVFALVYAVPVTLLGGTTQLLVTWMLKVTQNPMAIAWYLTTVALIGLVAMAMKRESAPAKLRALARA